MTCRRIGSQHGEAGCGHDQDRICGSARKRPVLRKPAAEAIRDPLMINGSFAQGVDPGAPETAQMPAVQRRMTSGEHAINGKMPKRRDPPPAEPPAESVDEATKEVNAGRPRPIEMQASGMERQFGAVIEPASDRLVVPADDGPAGLTGGRHCRAGGAHAHPQAQPSANRSWCN